MYGRCTGGARAACGRCWAPRPTTTRGPFLLVLGTHSCRAVPPLAALHQAAFRAACGHGDVGLGAAPSTATPPGLAPLKQLMGRSLLPLINAPNATSAWNASYSQMSRGPVMGLSMRTDT